MICSSLNRLFFISVSFRRSPIQSEGASGGNVSCDPQKNQHEALAAGALWAFDGEYKGHLTEQRSTAFSRVWVSSV
jgi:hypothetical protein